MTAPSRQPREAKPTAPRRKASIRLAGVEDRAAPSPVHQFHDALHDQWADAGPGGGKKWSGRRTFAFVALTCGGFWACVIVGAARLVR